VGDEKFVHFSEKNLRERDILKNQRIDGRIISKLKLMSFADMS
jgi:hypothetical protein